MVRWLDHNMVVDTGEVGLRNSVDGPTGSAVGSAIDLPAALSTRPSINLLPVADGSISVASECTSGSDDISGRPPSTEPSHELQHHLQSSDPQFHEPSAFGITSGPPTSDVGGSTGLRLPDNVICANAVRSPPRRPNGVGQPLEGDVIAADHVPDTATSGFELAHVDRPFTAAQHGADDLDCVRMSNSASTQSTPSRSDSTSTQHGDTSRLIWLRRRTTISPERQYQTTTDPYQSTV